MNIPLNENEKQRLAVLLLDPVLQKAVQNVLSVRKTSFSSMEAAAIAHGFNEGRAAFVSDLHALTREEKKTPNVSRARRIKHHSL